MNRVDGQHPSWALLSDILIIFVNFCMSVTAHPCIPIGVNSMLYDELISPAHFMLSMLYENRPVSKNNNKDNNIMNSSF